MLLLMLLMIYTSTGDENNFFFEKSSPLHKKKEQYFTYHINIYAFSVTLGFQIHFLYIGVLNIVIRRSRGRANIVKENCLLLSVRYFHKITTLGNLLTTSTLSSIEVAAPLDLQQIISISFA